MEGSPSINNPHGKASIPQNTLGKLSKIPLDMLNELFSHLDTNDLKNLGQVNKEMKARVEQECERRIKNAGLYDTFLKEQTSRPKLTITKFYMQRYDINKLLKPLQPLAEHIRNNPDQTLDKQGRIKYDFQVTESGKIVPVDKKEQSVPNLLVFSFYDIPKSPGNVVQLLNSCEVNCRNDPIEKLKFTKYQSTTTSPNIMIDCYINQNHPINKQINSIMQGFHQLAQQIASLDDKSIKARIKNAKKPELITIELNAYLDKKTLTKEDKLILAYFLISAEGHITNEYKPPAPTPKEASLLDKFRALFK